MRGRRANNKIESRIFFGGISILCPLFLLCLYLIQSYFEADWETEYKNGTPAIVLGALSDAILFFGCALVATVTGLIAGAISFRKQEKLWGIGAIGILCNLLPIVIFWLATVLDR